MERSGSRAGYTWPITIPILFPHWIKVADQGKPGESLRGTITEQAVHKTPSSQRWVPPNAREPLDHNELAFRKIRGILNKLTPDNFEKLSLGVTHHAGIGNKDTLKGIILLVFDKALDEPNYCSMYAQLCLTLNEFAPNFEETGSQNTTFRKLLLHKCQEEFENRRQATAAWLGPGNPLSEPLYDQESTSCSHAFDKRDGLTPEEEEQRSIDKRKMLGNIKFVGELFKLDMLHEAIIHSCIKELLERKRSQSMEDMCKSIECLCHFMTCVGQKLDTEKAKGWMAKYFERMSSLLNKDLPSRIRFMLMNVIELRKNNWSPRRSNADSAPRPIHEIRQEHYQERQAHRMHHGPLLHHPGPIDIPPPHFRGSGVPYYAPPPVGDEGFLSSPPGTKDGLMSPQEIITMATFPPPPIDVQQSTQLEKPVEKRLRKLPSTKSKDTVSLRPAMASLKLGSTRSQPSPPTSTVPAEDHTAGGKGIERHSPIPRTRDDSSDEEGPPTRRGVKGPFMPPMVPHPIPVYPPPGPYPPHMMIPRGTDPYFPRGPPPMPPPPHHGMRQRGPPFYGQPPPPGHMMPPGMLPHHGPPPARYFRPPPPNMYPPPRPPMPFGPPQWVPMGPERPPPPPQTDNRPLPAPLERNELVIKYASSKSGKKSAKKSETQGENEHQKKMEPIIDKFLSTQDTGTAVAAIESLEDITKGDVCMFLITKTLEKSEDDRTHISHLLKELHSKEFITGEHFLQAFTNIMGSVKDYEVNLPQCKTYVAGFVARAISKKMLKFAEVAPVFDQGSHHPTVLVVLQALVVLEGEDAVYQLFLESGVKLTSLLPPSHRSHSSITELMESRNLGFLYPLKRIQFELSTKLRQDASAVAIYKWIKNNVDSSFYPTPEFVMVLTRCILDHVTRGSSLAPDVSRKETPGKEIMTKEQELMKKFMILVRKFVDVNVPLQISALYATQVFCHDNAFPKGLLLRLFSYWYDEDVIDEEAFLKWKEDISQEYPGKGKALFQVNNWLVLLAEADDEESDEED